MIKLVHNRLPRRISSASPQ